MATREILDAAQKKELTLAKARIMRFMHIAAETKPSRVQTDSELSELFGSPVVDEKSLSTPNERQVFVLGDSEPTLLITIDPLNQPALDEEMLSLFGHREWPESKCLQRTEEDEVRNVFRFPIGNGKRTAFFQRITLFADQPCPESGDRRRVSSITYSVMAISPDMEHVVDQQILPPDMEQLLELPNIDLLGSIAMRN